MKFTGNKIETWPQFVKHIRSQKMELLQRLDQFPHSILVTGCQRSGTTALARLITQSAGMTNYWFGQDDELDAALILCGAVEHAPHGRYCFQTTYVNDSLPEYFEHHNGHKIIWVLRNPYSVVYSMLHNWKRHALNQLFVQCGLSALSSNDLRRYQRWGTFGFGRLKKACYAYVGKTNHFFALKNGILPDNFLAVEYDAMVQNKEAILPEIYKFIGLDYREEYSARIVARSVNKSDQLSQKDKEVIKGICWPVYEESLQELTTMTSKRF